MQEYTSKQVRIRRPAALVYGALSDFTNFTPVVRERVEGWEATTDECSFVVKGMTVGLRIVEREENKLIKLTGTRGVPFEFTLWLQLHEVAADDTRMRLVLHANLNMMMRMMVGNKLAEGIDQAAQQIADMFNGMP